MFSRTITSHLPSSSSSTASTLSRSLLSIPCTCSHVTSSRSFATTSSNPSSTPKSTSSSSSTSTVSPTVAASLPRTYRPRPDTLTPIQRTYDRHWDDPWRDPPKEPFRSKKHPLHFDNRPVFPRDRHTRHGQGDARANPQPEIIPDPELAPGTDEKEWKIHTAMVIERMPVVYATPEPWQLEWERFQTSRKQKTRITLPEELLTKKRDGEDEELPEEFIPGPTETKDDKENNMRSMNRCLRTSLFLLVKKPDAQFPWSFCEAPHDYTTKHLRASAEAAMRRDIGKNLGVHIMGNAPFGHHSYEFDEERLETSEGRKGAKVFYMHALWLDGDVEIDMKNVIDYAWVPKARLHEYLAPEECAVMKKILLGYD